ncbi:hypothetical protein [Leyella stercorea]
MLRQARHYTLFLQSASTDAYVRIDRRRCSYRPTQMSVSTDADARNDRCGWQNSTS